MITEAKGQIGLAPTALVVEGGAMRGIFTTGVLDGFLEQGFNPFDLYVGVSAGAGNLAAYLADMPGRNRTIYTDLSIRPEFISLFRFLRGGHLMDLDWMWDVTIAQMRLDLKAIYRRRKPFLVGLTDVATGKAFSKETSAEDLEHLLKASSALPVFYRDFPLVDGRSVADGGVSDPIPVGEAIRRGSRRIMVIRSRPRGFLRKRDVSSYFMSWFLKSHPDLRAAVLNQNMIYNQAVSLIQNPPPGVAIVEVSPPAGFRLERFTRDAAALLEGYEQGRLAAEDAVSRWGEFRTDSP
jgi:predicted patatin/cPLA2 family phospholipase